jgi:hypothetical protein
MILKLLSISIQRFDKSRGKIMVKNWRGIKKIKEESIKELIEKKENDYIFYSAPQGYKLILSIIINKLPAWKMEIKDFGIPIKKNENGILRRGFSSGDEEMVSDKDNPILELVKAEKMDVKELKRHIKEEREKARLRVQGRTTT